MKDVIIMVQSVLLVVFVSIPMLLLLEKVSTGRLLLNKLETSEERPEASGNSLSMACWETTFLGLSGQCLGTAVAPSRAEDGEMSPVFSKWRGANSLRESNLLCWVYSTDALFLTAPQRFGVPGLGLVPRDNARDGGGELVLSPATSWVGGVITDIAIWAPPAAGRAQEEQHGLPCRSLVAPGGHRTV